MINHADIENIIGCKTLVTDRMQQAIEGWYDAAINGLPLSRDPETLSLGLPAVICSELARLTTLELDAKVEGSPRADWVNTQLQRVLGPPQTAEIRPRAGAGQRHLEALPEWPQPRHQLQQRQPVLSGSARHRWQPD